MEEEEEIIYKNLGQSPKMAQGSGLFQLNRFTKNNNFSIPDTIPEQSGELSSNSLQSEVPKIVIDSVQSNSACETFQSSKSDESSNASTVIPMDNSFLLDCERKLLECSSSDDDKNNLSIDRASFHESISRKLSFLNDTIATPPNELRHKISILRDEIAESHEFHDIEMQIMIEDLEKKYVDLVEKYTSLMELYTTLKKEYENYRNEQDNFKQEIHSKTADYFENLCSQIEESDGSFTVSNISIASFNTDVKSSTMLGNLTEKEISIINNSTLTTHDPLSVTNDTSNLITFKTPKMTPLKSSKRMLNMDVSNIKTKSAIKNVQPLKQVVPLKEDSTQFNSKLFTKISDLEVLLMEKIQEIRELEQRLFRVENLPTELQNERDRIKILSDKIVESESRIKELEGFKKLSDDFKQKYDNAESIISAQHAEIQSLQMKETEYSKISEKLVATQETLVTLQSKIDMISNDKADILNNYQKLEEDFKSLKMELIEKEKRLDETMSLKDTATMDNENLRQLIHQSEEKVTDLEGKLFAVQFESSQLKETIKVICSNKDIFIDWFTNNSWNEIDLNAEYLQPFADKLKLTLTQENIELITFVIKLVANCCAQFKDESQKVKETEKIEWDQQRKEDMFLINSLQNEIKTLRDGMQVYVTKLNEYEEVRDMCDDLRKEISEAQEIILRKDEEILKLQAVEEKKKIEVESHEVRSLDVDLNHADYVEMDTINKCQELEEGISKLKAEIEAKESVMTEMKLSLASFDEMKLELENLRNLVRQSDECVVTLKSELHDLKRYNNTYDIITKAFKENKESVAALYSHFILNANEMNNVDIKMLAEAIQLMNHKIEITNCGENDLLYVVKDVLDECCSSIKEESDRNFKLKTLEWQSEKREDLNTIESLRSDLKSLGDQLMEYESKMTETQALCDALRDQLTVAETLISEKDEKISALQSLETQKIKVQDDLGQAEELITKLQSELSMAVDGKSEVESKYNQLEEEVCSLKTQIEEKDTILKDLECFKESCEEFKSNIENLKDIINELNVELNEVKNESDQIKSERKKDVSLIDNLKNEIKTLENGIQEYVIKLNELDDAKDMCATLNKAISEAQDAIVKKDEEIQEFRSIESIKNKMEDDLVEAQNTIQQLQSQINLTDNDKIEISNKCQKLEEEISKLNTKINEVTEVQISYDALKDQFASEKNEQIKAIKFLESQKNKVEEDLGEAEKLIAKLQSELTAAIAAKTDVDTKNSQLEVEVNSLNIQIEEKETLSKDLEFFKGSCEELKCKIEDLNDIINDLNGELEEIKNKSDQLKSEKMEDISLIENLQNDIKTLENGIEEYVSKLNELDDVKNMCNIIREELGKAQEDILKKDEEIQGFQSLEAVKSRMENDLVNAQNIIEQLKSQINLTDNDKMQITNKCHKLEEEISDLKTKINEFNEIQMLCDSLKDQLAVAETLMSEKDEKISALRLIEAQKINVQEDLDQAKQLISKLQSELSTAVDDKSEAESKYKQLEEEVCSLKTQIEEKESFLKELECFKESCEKHQNNIESLNAVIEDLNAELNEVKNESDQIKFERKKDMSLIENLHNEIKHLKDTIVHYEARVSDLEHSQKKLEIINDEVVKIKASLSEKIDEITNLNIHKGEIESELFETRKTNAEFEEKLIEMLKCCQTLENEVKSKETLVKNLEKSLTSYGDLKLDNETMKEAIQKSEKIAVDLRLELASATEKLSRNEMLIREVTSLKKENNGFKNMFEALRANKKAVADISKTSFNFNEMADVNVISEKMKLSLINSNNETESGTFFSIISETIIDCCKSLQEELKKGFEEEKTKRDDLNNLKCRVDALIAENDSLESRVVDLMKEIAELKKERDDFLDLSGKIQKLEDDKHKLTDVLSDIQGCLDMPNDTVFKLLSGNFENRKIFSECINKYMNTPIEDLRKESTQLKLSNDSLKEKVKDLSKIINEFSRQKEREEAPLNLSNSFVHSKVLRSTSTRNVDLCTRRLDKLEEINHNLTELVTRILTMTEFPNVDKLKFMSVRDYANISKKVVSHFQKMASKVQELEETNNQLDEECDSYARTIKDLRKEAATVWKANKDKVDALESELKVLKEEKDVLEKEKNDLMAKVAKLEETCLKLRNSLVPEGTTNICNCSNELKKLHDLKRTILIKEQKILELEDLGNQNSMFKSQIKYLENALEQEKKKIRQEKEKMKKLQAEVEELTKNQKQNDKKNQGEMEILDELRMRGSVTGGVVQEFVDKEKMRKLSKDIGILKELCRARYAEIKRLEAENAALKNSTSKNSNQMNSPLRVRSYNTRSKNGIGKAEAWKPETEGKENRV